MRPLYALLEPLARLQLDLTRKPHLFTSPSAASPPSPSVRIVPTSQQSPIIWYNVYLLVDDNELLLALLRARISFARAGGISWILTAHYGAFLTGALARVQSLRCALGHFAQCFKLLKERRRPTARSLPAQQVRCIEPDIADSALRFTETA